MATSPSRRYTRRLNALERRAKFLSTRLHVSTKDGQLPGYDQQELSALLWAIEVIKDEPERARGLLSSNDREEGEIGI